jgi:hypothetical protein
MAVAVAAALLCTMTATARAQTPEPMPAEMDSGTTFADATGAMWGVAAFEGWLVLAAMGLAASNGCGHGDEEELTCAGLVALATIAAGVTSGLAADVAQAPADAPFLGHHVLWGGLTGLMLGFGLAGDDDDTRAVLGSAGVLLGAVIAGAYVWSRREHLLHDPGAATGVHIATWGVPVGGLIGAIVGILLDDDDPSTMGLVASAAALITYGIGFGLAEAGSE